MSSKALSLYAKQSSLTTILYLYPVDPVNPVYNFVRVCLCGSVAKTSFASSEALLKEPTCQRRAGFDPQAAPQVLCALHPSPFSLYPFFMSEYNRLKVQSHIPDATVQPSYPESKSTHCCSGHPDHQNTSQSPGRHSHRPVSPIDLLRGPDHSSTLSPMSPSKNYISPPFPAPTDTAPPSFPRMASCPAPGNTPSFFSANNSSAGKGTLSDSFGNLYKHPGPQTRYRFLLALSLLLGTHRHRTVRYSDYIAQGKSVYVLRDTSRSLPPTPSQKKCPEAENALVYN